VLLIRDSEDLLDAFRPLDLRLFELPGEDAFPMLLRGTRAWVESGGARAYLLFEEPGTGRARGIVFRRSNVGGPTGQMCSWCHSFGTSDEIGLMTADESAHRKVGVYVCRDLHCWERIEEACDRAGTDTRVHRARLLERIARFAHEALRMEA